MGLLFDSVSVVFLTTGVCKIPPSWSNLNVYAPTILGGKTQICKFPGYILLYKWKHFHFYSLRPNLLVAVESSFFDILHSGTWGYYNIYRDNRYTKYTDSRNYNWYSGVFSFHSSIFAISTDGFVVILLNHIYWNRSNLNFHRISAYRE